MTSLPLISFYHTVSIFHVHSASCWWFVKSNWPIQDIIKYEKLKLFLLMHACNLITLMATRILKLMAKLNYSKLDIILQEITRGTARLWTLVEKWLQFELQRCLLTPLKCAGLLVCNALLPPFHCPQHAVTHFFFFNTITKFYKLIQLFELYKSDLKMISLGLLALLELVSSSLS